MRSIAREVLYILAALIAVNLLALGAQGLRHVPADALFHIVVTALALSIALLVKVYAVRHEVFELLNHYRRLDTSVARPVLAFLRPKLRAHLEEGRQLAKEGMTLAETELEGLVAVSFDSCGTSYLGTDRHVPSRLSQLYPTYLKRQIDRKGLSLGCDTRFLLVGRAELERDFATNPEDVRSFVDEHANSGIMLLQVEPALADDRATKYRLVSKDVGVFGWTFVIFYEPPSAGTTSVRVRVLPLTAVLKERLALFFVELNQSAKRVEMVGEELRITDRRREDIQAQRHRMFENRDWPPGSKGGQSE